MRYPICGIPAFLGAISGMELIVSIQTRPESKPQLMACSYSTAPEILAYFKNVAEKYDLLKYVRLSQRVVGAYWQEDTQEWLVSVQRGDNPEDVFEDRCNLLVNASGVLKYICSHEFKS